MSTDNPDRVHIAAGGYGTRIRETMVELGYPPEYPKHLLPTGAFTGETLLGRVIQQAHTAPTQEVPVVYANRSNIDILSRHHDIRGLAQVVLGHSDNSLGPFTDSLVSTRRRTLGCAGDFYADFKWSDVLDGHESNGFPVTFMVGHTVETDGGAVFDVADNGQIERLRRAPRTSEDDLVNIGVYVFDPSKETLRILEDLAHSCRLRNVRLKEDLIVRDLIERGLAGAYILPTAAFNVNTAETYRALLAHNHPEDSTIAHGHEAVG